MFAMSATRDSARMCEKLTTCGIGVVWTRNKHMNCSCCGAVRDGNSDAAYLRSQPVTVVTESHKPRAWVSMRCDEVDIGSCLSKQHICQYAPGITS